MTEYTIDMIKGTTVMEQMRSLIKVVIDFINGEGGTIDDLRQMIQTEIQDREQHDSEIREEIQDEKRARLLNDEILQTAINSEQSARTLADENLQTSINNEQTARVQQVERFNAEINRINGELNTERWQRGREIQEVKEDLQTEESQRRMADGVLQDNINAEQSQRQEQDTTLTTGLSTVETNLQAEITNREQQDNALMQAIEAFPFIIGKSLMFREIDTTNITIQNQLYAKLKSEIPDNILESGQLILFGETGGNLVADPFTIYPSLFVVTATSSTSLMLTGCTSFIWNGRPAVMKSMTIDNAQVEQKIQTIDQQHSGYLVDLFGTCTLKILDVFDHRN